MCEKRMGRKEGLGELPPLGYAKLCKKFKSIQRQKVNSSHRRNMDNCYMNEVMFFQIQVSVMLL